MYPASWKVAEPVTSPLNATVTALDKPAASVAKLAVPVKSPVTSAVTELNETSSVVPTACPILIAPPENPTPVPADK